jgi:hypothetical protein
MISNAEFYIAENGEQKGPFSLPDLKEMAILKSTLIWKEGYENWVEAETIPELNSIIKRVPPPLPKIAQQIKEEEKTLNVNLAFFKKKPVDKLNNEARLLKEKNKVKTAKEIKIASKILGWGLLFALLFYSIAALMVKDGFLALKYKFELKNCNYNCREVHFDIVGLGKMNNTLVTYEVSHPTTQTEKDITSGVYFLPDLIKYYSKQYNLEPESIIEHEERTSTEVDNWYTYLKIARFDETIDETIDNAFGNKTVVETILFYLISSFLVIIGRYIYFASKKTEQWIDTYSKKEL